MGVENQKEIKFGITRYFCLGEAAKEALFGAQEAFPTIKRIEKAKTLVGEISKKTLGKAKKDFLASTGPLVKTLETSINSLF